MSADPAILEAAARALEDWFNDDGRYLAAKDVVAAVTPLIEAQTLEQAAKVAEGFKTDLPPGIGRGIAAAIRALKKQLPP